MAKTRGRNKTRKHNSGSGGSGIFGILWSPFHHFFMATGESVVTVGSSAGNIVKKGVNTVDTVGMTYARHAKQMVNNIRGRARTRRANKTAKN